MLTDRYDLPLSTASDTARDAYVAGCERLLSVYPGALEHFDRAIAADPGFALAHARKAQVLLGVGSAAAARTSMTDAQAAAGGLQAWEASHIEFFDLYVAGQTDAALAALLEHLRSWPRDALALTTTAFTNGLIGSAGHPGVKRRMAELLDTLAPHYGDDWWFAAHHGMALSENGQRAAAHAKIDRSIASHPRNGWAAHARTHLCYEAGDAAAARAYLAPFLAEYPRDAALFSHLNWHLALSDLGAGDTAEASRLYHAAFCLDVHAGAPRAKVTDGVSFLWRMELAGQQRDAVAWQAMRDFAAEALPRAGTALSDAHVALALVVAGDTAGLAARLDQIEALTRQGRYASGPIVPALTLGFAAFERRDFPAAIEALEQVTRESERLGGSWAQLDLVEFTLARAYVDSGRLDDARALLARRRAGNSVLAVSGLDRVIGHAPALMPKSAADQASEAP